MNPYAASLQALAPLFILILVGYGLKRARLLHAAHVPVMNNLVVSVTMPALVVYGLATAKTLPLAAAKPVIAMLATEFAIMLAIAALARFVKVSRTAFGCMLMVGAFGNTGFLGYPMTLALMKPAFPIAILIDQFGLSVPLYLGAALIGSSYGQLAGAATRLELMTRFLRSPLFLAVVLGVGCRVIPWPIHLLNIPLIKDVGHTVGQCLVYLGQGTIPLVLLAFGVSLKPVGARSALPEIVIACVMKLVASPIIIWGICRLLNAPVELRSVAVLLAAMPTSVMSSVLCAQNGLDGETAVSVVFITTVISFVSVPLMLTLLR